MSEDIAAAAYVAGILDGEGSIGIKRRMPTKANKMASPRYSVSVCISMTDIDVVKFVAAFAGEPNKVTSRKRNDKYKTIYEFAVEYKRAASLIRKVLPYLVGKKERARLALELDEFQTHSREHRTKVTRFSFCGGINKGHSYRMFSLSDEYIARCEEIYEALRLLPRRTNFEIRKIAT